MRNEDFTAMVNAGKGFTAGDVANERIASPRSGQGLSNTDPAVRLALAYAPNALQWAYAAFFALDAQLRRNAATPREPALVQLRLAWWRDALTGLERVGEASHPVLRVVSEHLSRRASFLVALVDAWEASAVGEDGLNAASTLGQARAGVMRIKAEDNPALDNAALAWSLVDSAALASSTDERIQFLNSARDLPARRLSAAYRPFAVLGGLAQRAARRGDTTLLGDRLSPFAGIRLGIFGR